MIFATPQVIKNDLIAGRYALTDVTLLIVDECHRAVGNYAYVFLAQRYLGTAAKPLILAMTASPGGAQEKVQDVCANLGISHIENRTENDPDVSPYVFERDIETITIDIPPEIKIAINTINQAHRRTTCNPCIAEFYRPKTRSAHDENARCDQCSDPATHPRAGPDCLCSASVYAECMKLRHAITLAESQGSEVFKGYIAKLVAEGKSSGGSKASQRLAKDPIFRNSTSGPLSGHRNCTQNRKSC